MTYIEGVGDEVIYLLAGACVFITTIVLWVSTSLTCHRQLPSTAGPNTPNSQNAELQNGRNNNAHSQLETLGRNLYDTVLGGDRITTDETGLTRRQSPVGDNETSEPFFISGEELEAINNEWAVPDEHGFADRDHVTSHQSVESNSNTVTQENKPIDGDHQALNTNSNNRSASDNSSDNQSTNNLQNNTSLPLDVPETINVDTLRKARLQFLERKCSVDPLDVNITEVSRDVNNTELSLDVNITELSRDVNNTELSRDVNNTELSRDANNTELSRDVNNTELSRDPTPIALENDNNTDGRVLKTEQTDLQQEGQQQCNDASESSPSVQSAGNESPTATEEQTTLTQRRPTVHQELAPGHIRVKLRYMNETQKVVQAKPEDTLNNFKMNNFARELGDNLRVRLIHNGHELRDSTRSLHSYNILDNSVVHCLLSSVQLQPDAHAHAQDDAQVLDIGHLVMPLFGVMILLVWYCRLEYKQYFTVLSTVSLIGVTFLFVIALLASQRNRNALDDHNIE